MHQRRFIKAAVGLALAGGSIVLVASGAGAAKPAVRACVGTTDASLATNQTSPGEFGHGAAFFARNSATPGLGADIQALQAGLVPDVIVPNTCNG